MKFGKTVFAIKLKMSVLGDVWDFKSPKALHTLGHCIHRGRSCRDNLCPKTLERRSPCLN